MLIFGWFIRLIDQLFVIYVLIAFRLCVKNHIKISLLFMSRDRYRYFKYYKSSISRNSIVLYKANRLSIALAAILFSEYDYECLFSDMDFATHSIAKSLIDAPFMVLSWNGVSEVDDYKRKFPGIRVMSVISGDGAIRLKPSYFFTCHKINHKRERKQIFFAGQLKPPQYFLNSCSSPLLAHDIVLNSPPLFTMPNIFTYVENLNRNKQINISDMDFIRMALAALMREKYLKSIIKEFGTLVTVCGSDFDRMEFQKCNRISNLNASQIKNMYEVSAVALDFGSQCGFEALYPRSLEILDVNPAALMQAHLQDSEKVFFGIDTPRWFKSEDDLLVGIDKALLMTDVEIRHMASTIRNNVNLLME